MKFLTIFLFPVIFLMACGGQNEKSKPNGFDPANLQTIEISVHGMTCSGCENTVKSALEKLPGVQSAVASHTDSTTIVTFDNTKTDFDAMALAIKGRGYTVQGFRTIND